jgi:hypothetical protein
MLRLIPIPLCALLVVAGCSTTKPLITRDMRSVLPAGKDAIQFPTVGGDTFRLGPNSEIRFLLHSGESTGWIRGRNLMRSELGLSFEEGGKVYFIAWEELYGAEVQNLSGGKTVAVIGLVAVILGVIVVLVASKGKGGGSALSGLGSGGSGGSVRTGGRTRVVRSFRGSRALHHRRLIRPRGGVHIHIPLIIAAGHHHRHHHAPPRDAPPPPPPGAAPPPPGPAPAGGAVDIHAPPAAAAPAAAPQVKRTPSPAVPLFNGRARRRSKIQLVTSVEAGTELARFQGYTGSLFAGIRLRDVFEIGGGLRHGIDPLRRNFGLESDNSLVGFGRLGFHFWLDDNHYVAIPLSVDVGAGYQARFHLKVNYGLRFAPIRNLWIGLMPFNVSYTRFDNGGPDGTFTFPTTLELGFSY